MKQILVIHGGTTFSTHIDYINFLKNKTVQLERLLYTPSWRENLQEKLGSDYQVLLPSMPNKSNARYDEWKIWFERIIEVIDNNCILIGHSLGGIFLARYLSENKVPKYITATIFIAAPYNDETSENLTDFKITSITPLLSEQSGQLIFFHGHNDPIVPIEELHKYQEYLPQAQYHVLPAPDHFVRNEFPELIEAIKAL